MLFIRIFIPHAYIPHYPAAPWIISVMGCCQIRDAAFPGTFHSGRNSFCHDTSMPEFLPQSIAKVIRLFIADIHITYGVIISLQADSIGKCCRISISAIKNRLRIIDILSRKPWKKPINFLITVDQIQRMQITLNEPSEDKMLRFKHRDIHSLGF